MCNYLNTWTLSTIKGAKLKPSRPGSTWVSSPVHLICDSLICPFYCISQTQPTTLTVTLWLPLPLSPRNSHLRQPVDSSRPRRPAGGPPRGRSPHSGCPRRRPPSQSAGAASPRRRCPPCWSVRSREETGRDVVLLKGRMYWSRSDIRKWKQEGKMITVNMLININHSYSVLEEVHTYLLLKLKY